MRASVSDEVVLAHHHAHPHAELLPLNPRTTLLNEAALILVTWTTLILSRGFLSTQNWHSQGHFLPWVIATWMLTVAAHFVNNGYVIAEITYSTAHVRQEVLVWSWGTLYGMLM